MRPDGSLWCWGGNINGQLGLGDVMNRAAPTRVGTETDWHSVSPSANLHKSFTCARDATGTLWSWGTNANGELGLGDTTGRSAPTPITNGL